MKLSRKWLNSYFTIIPDWDDILYKLTAAGIEVEGVEDIDGDQIIEFKITPNRGDALSVLGILREIELLTEHNIRKPPHNIDFVSNLADKIQTEVKESTACPNYFTVIIKNVNNKVQLPVEIIDRITASGMRCVSPIVDITNYVMLELGQPLHAFDLNKVGNKLIVRRALEKEELTLLSGVVAKLTTDTLLICDQQNKPAAIAGVMGGADSGVSEATTAIVLESAFFNPEIISGKTKYYGVSSDSAYRFERGVDSQLQRQAIEYAAALIIKYCGGQGGVVANCSVEYQPRHLTFNYQAIRRLIGCDISNDIINKILIKADFKLCENNQADEKSHIDALNVNLAAENGNVTVVVPSYRFDVSIKEDIAEEIARVYGYDNIPAQIPLTQYTMDMLDINVPQQLKTILVNLGYNEIISYAFIEDKAEEKFGCTTPVYLKNPIANLNVMRTSLIADLIKVLTHNLNYGRKHMRIFELARVFHGESKEQQPLRLSGLVYGDFVPAKWFNKNRPVDFYDLRNDVEILLSGLGKVKFVPCCDNTIFHSGRCAAILLNEKEVGVLGQLHPQFKAEYGFSELPYIFELNIESMTKLQPDLLVHEVNKFPKVERDLAFLTEATVKVGNILEVIEHAGIPYLMESSVFDIYQGNNLANIKLNDNPVKSVAIKFVFQGNKTLTEEEINTSMNKVRQCIEGSFNVQLRV